MNITLEFTINEMVKLTISKRGEFTGEIVSINIDREMNVTYLVMSIGRIYRRTADQLKHIKKEGKIGRCHCCDEEKTIVFEKYCKDCLYIISLDKKRIIKELKKAVDSNKRSLLSGNKRKISH